MHNCLCKPKLLIYVWVCRILNVGTETTILLRKKLSLISFIVILECWDNVPHERPNFLDIYRTLEVISTSAFIATLDETFHDLQDDWRHEIEDMFEELRAKEQVELMSRRCCKNSHCISFENFWTRPVFFMKTCSVPHLIYLLSQWSIVTIC